MLAVDSLWMGLRKERVAELLNYKYRPLKNNLWRIDSDLNPSFRLRYTFFHFKNGLLVQVTYSFFPNLM